MAELRRALCDVLGSGDVLPPLVSEQQLKARVYRLGFSLRGQTRSLIIKRLDPELARRNCLVAKRWLPLVEMADHGPPLLGVAAEISGASVWHIYDDLGDWALDGRHDDTAVVAAAVEVIARLHSSFREHPILGECRLWGAGVGIQSYTWNVHDALRAIAPLCSAPVASSREHALLCDRLSQRLHALLDEEPAVMRALGELGGPETLLHGDLWTTNTMVIPGPRRPLVRIIDWDHAGVGSISYDLSTFLYRFRPRDRPSVLALYERHMAGAGWRLPSRAQLDVLFTAAECARLANRVMWPAIAVMEGQVEWGFAELARVDEWFQTLKPVFGSGAV
jgi:hypothetical protein